MSGCTPSPHPLPQGGEGFAVLSPLPEGEGRVRALFPYRVIASAAKQPSRLPRTHPDVPLGCFGAMRLAMTRGTSIPSPVFPAQAGTQTLTHRLESMIWIPAFAGNAAQSVGMLPPTPASPVLPPKGEDLSSLIFPLWGKWPEGPKGALLPPKRKPPLRFPSAAAQSFPKERSTIRRSWPRRQRRRCGHLRG